MAADVAVTYSFVNGTNVDASRHNTNFNDIVAWLNANVVHLDGSKAFTGIPSGPASNPTTDNQLARKKYVDDKTWGTANIDALAITAAKLAADAVTTVKILDANVTGPKIANDAIDSQHYADGSIDTAHIADAQVTGTKIANDTITTANIAAGNFADIKNTKLADYCGRARADAPQTLAHNTETAIRFEGADDYDYESMHDPTTNNGTRITAPVAGVWHFTASIPLEGSATGGRLVTMKRYNSAGVLQDYVATSALDAGDSGFGHYITVSGSCLMAAGDYIRVMATQTSGGNLDTVFFGEYCSIVWECVRLT